MLHVLTSSHNHVSHDFRFTLGPNKVRRGKRSRNFAMAAIRRLFRRFTGKPRRQERTVQTMGDQTDEIVKGMSQLAVRDKEVGGVPYEMATFALS